MASEARQQAGVGADAPLREPIALVGVGCRFPGGCDGPDRYWSFLRRGGDGVVEAPAGRLDIAALYDPEPARPGKLYSRHLGALGAVEDFDAGFFGISPREAATVDPQQRLLLEVAWESLEHAGIAPGDLAGARVGVFVGAFSDDYAQARLYDRDPVELDGHTGLSILRGLAAGRIAYHLDLHGPAMTVDTACSSSLLAIHLACRSLWSSECDAALAGGVNLVLSPEVTVGLCQLRALSRRGRCRAFDGGADGYVRGEGAGIVVLKRLSDALADGDRVIAVVRGSAVNHDGRSNGISAPSLAAQEAVIRAALADAGVAPGALDYVEAHGTGTALGDPIEVRALANVLGDGRAAPLPIGSVKSNIGHLEAAAGVAGFVKLALALARRELPPSLHFDTPNPHIPWDRIPVVVASRPMPLPAKRPMGSVSAFGMSGTNVHMVLEAPPEAAASPASADDVHVVPLSARSPDALRRLADGYRAMLSEGTAPEIRDIAFTAGAGRAHHGVRHAVVADSAAELEAGLAGLPSEMAPFRGAPRVGFVLSGRLADRGAVLSFLGGEPAARDALAAADAAVGDILGGPLRDLAGRPDLPDADARLADICISAALAALWRGWGIAPVALLGTGDGEYAAALAAGAIDVPAVAAFLAARRDTAPDPAALRAAFAAAARAGRLSRPEIPVISGMLGRPVAEELRSPYYWADHAAKAADMAAAARALADASLDTVVEIGIAAGPALPDVRRLAMPAGTNLRRGFLDGLAALYRQGASVAWRAVAHGGRRAALPTYPFERVPCRIGRGGRSHAGPAREAEPREQPFDVAGSPRRHVATRLTGEERALLADHPGPGGKPAMPGAALCDIAAAAGRSVLGIPDLVLEDVVFRALLPLDPAPELQTAIAEDGTFELYARASEDRTVGAWTLHATGRLRPADSVAPAAPAPLPAAATRQPGAAVHDRLARAGRAYGPGFRALAEVRVLGREAEARIAIGDAAAAAGRRFALHPALLDACLLSVEPLLPEAGSGRTWLPSGIARLECFAPLPARVTARATLDADGAGEAAANILILDEERTVVAGIAGFALRAVATQAAAAPVPELYDVAWRPMAAARPAQPARPLSWAVAGDGTAAAGLARRLAAQGHRCHRVGGPDIPAADRVAVFATERAGGPVERAWRVLEAVRAAARRSVPGTRVAIVTSGAQSAVSGEPVADVDGAAIWGLARVARRELPGSDIVTVDMPEGAGEAELDRLARLLETAPPGEEVALRAGGTLVSRLVARPAAGRGRAPVPVREDATYLVTGGLGGLGLFTATWLVGRGARHIVLVGRSQPGEPARNAVAALEADGAAVVVAAADVADGDAMAAVFERIDRALPPLAGVVHAAGVLDDALLAGQTRERLAAALRPKLDGARVLDRLTRGRALDFFLVYASAAGILGNPGQASYAAANAALDALALARTAAGLPTVAVDWGPWADVGMAARAGLPRGGMAPIAPADAGELLARLIGSAEPQAVALAADWPAYLAANRPAPPLLEAFSGRGEAHASRAAAEANGALLAELRSVARSERARRLKTHVRKLVASALEIAPETIDPRQELAALGFDSLMNMELKSGLERGLGVALGSTLVFDHPTVDAITRHLVEDVIRWDAATPDNPSSGGRDAGDVGPIAADVEAALAIELGSLSDLRPA